MTMDVKLCDICCESTLNGSGGEDRSTTSEDGEELLPGAQGLKVLNDHLLVYFIANKLMNCSDVESLSLLRKDEDNEALKGVEHFKACGKCERMISDALELHCKISALQREMSKLAEALGCQMQNCRNKEKAHVTRSVGHQLRSILPLGDRDFDIANDVKLEVESDSDVFLFDEDDIDFEGSLDSNDFARVVKEEEVSRKSTPRNKNGSRARLRRSYDSQFTNEPENLLDDNCSVTEPESKSLAPKTKSYDKLSDGSFHCKLCESVYTTVPGIIKHDRMHKESRLLGNIYACSICRHPNLSESKSRRHMTKVHGIRKKKGAISFKEVERLENVDDRLKDEEASSDGKSSNIDADLNDNDEDSDYVPEFTNSRRRIKKFRTTKRILQTAKRRIAKAWRPSPVNKEDNSTDKDAPTETYSCQLCESVYTTTAGFNKHMRAHEQSKLLGNKYDCPTCRHPTVSESNLRRHMTAIHQIRVPGIDADGSFQLSAPSSETIIGTSVNVGGLPEEAGTSTAECASIVQPSAGKFGCRRCESVYTSIPGIRKHEQRHKDSDLLDNLYDCPICRHPTVSEKNLRIHIANTHQNRISAKHREEMAKKIPNLETSDENFRCDRCESVYTTIPGIRKHEQRHRESDELGNHYDCPVCRHPTVSVKNLRLHMTMVHQMTISGIKRQEKRKLTIHSQAKVRRKASPSIERPMTPENAIDVTETDDKTATENTSYRKSSSEDFHCNLCDSVYTTVPGIRKHEKMHEGSKLLGNIHDCTICRHPNLSDSKLRRHMTKVHGIQQTKEKSNKRKIDEEEEEEEEGAIGNQNDEEWAPFEKESTTQHDLQGNFGERSSDDGINELYRCEPCNVGYKSARGFQRHEKEHQASISLGHKYDCHCGFPASSERRLRYHKKRAHFDGVTCLVCDFRAQKPEDLKVHMRKHNKYYTCKTTRKIVDRRVRIRNRQSGKMECRKCKSTYWYSRSYKKHMEDHQKSDLINKIWDCNVCGFPCLSEKKLELHKTKHGGRRVTCSICKKVCANTSLLKSHMRLHLEYDKAEDPETGLFCCKLCNYTGRSRRALLNHKTALHREVTLDSSVEYLLCPQCGKSFYTLGTLKKHIKNIHDNIYKYTCDQCGKGFDQKTAFTNHKTTHEGIRTKQHICDICGASYSRRHTLTDHMSKYHSNQVKNLPASARDGRRFPIEKDYICKWCQTVFPFKYMLVNHVSNAHQDLYTFRCDQCDKKYITGSSLKLHKEISHSDGSQSVSCEYCQKVFMHRHYATCHYKFCEAKKNADKAAAKVEER